MNLEDNFQILRNQAYSNMMKSRGDKYKKFLFLLKSFKFIPGFKQRGKFLEAYYVLMRSIDDIADRDSQVPQGFSNPEEFVTDKIDFSKRLRKPKDSIDYLLLYCNELGNRFGEDFSNETEDILGSILFDARRYGKNIVFPKDELENHFYLLDIRGTIRAALKVYGEDPNKFEVLKPLGVASRIYYDLRDYGEDIRSGLVNITLEDSLRLGINSYERDSLEINSWFREQAELGLCLLDEHKRTVAKGDFKLVTRLTLPIVYERAARRYFEQVLAT